MFKYEKRQGKTIIQANVEIKNMENTLNTDIERKKI